MITVHVKDILEAEGAIVRWKSLELPAPMALTLAILISAIQPAVQGYVEQAQKYGKEIKDLRDQVMADARLAVEGTDEPMRPDLTPVTAKADESNAQLEEASRLLVELPIGKIPLSAFPKARIKPTVEELISVLWLVEMDMDLNADWPEYEEAKPLKKERPNDQPIE